MKTILAVPILTLALLASTGCAHPKAAPQGATKAEGVPLVGTFTVNQYVLENGLRLLVVEDHSSPTFAYQTWYRVGSRDEIPGYTGLAHLFEHMMFKGTQDLKEGEFDRILESAGVEDENAFTSRDYTAYVQELPSDKLDLIAKLEADRMVNLVVNDASFKTEREVVQNERRFRNENSPDGLMYQDLFGLAFKTHSYRWPVIGYPQDLERMTAADARKFYQEYYSPNHATVVVVGDVKPESVLGIVKKYYGGLTPQMAPAHPVASEPPQKTPRSKTLKLNIQVEKLYMGYHIPGILDADIPALTVLQSILTGGKSSRLYRALVDSGIASATDSYDLEDKDPSLFILFANLQKGKRATQAEKVMLNEIAKLIREPVDEEELARARNRVNFDFYEGLGTDNAKAHFLGHYEAVGASFEVGIEQHQKTQTVTAEQVRAVAKRYLSPTNRSVMIGVHK